VEVTWKTVGTVTAISHRETATTMTTTTGGELLTFAQAAQRLNLGVLDIRRMVRTEQCPVVTDERGRRRIPAWVADPARVAERRPPDRRR
jgi:hypothetical protein